MGQTVVDVAGRDIPTQKRGGKDPTRDQLQARLSRQQTSGVDFEPVQFDAFVKSARIVPGGELEVVLSVEPGQKYAALPITDAADFMVHITAEKVVRDE